MRIAVRNASSSDVGRERALESPIVVDPSDALE
jgi:hypothetical protein